MSSDEHDILVKYAPRNHIKNREAFFGQLRGMLSGRVEEAWLFGSVARGDFTQRSDVDLILVVQTNRSFFERINDFDDLYRLGHEMDILIYTPGEFEGQKNRAAGNSFWRDILNEMVRVV